MWATFLIALREGLEAALVVGIVLSVLQRLGQRRQRGAVWAGVGVAVALSALAGLVLNALGVVLEGPAEPIFEGTTMLLAAGILTWMIFWMQRQGRQVQAGLEEEVQRALARGSGGLFAVALVAVLREGIETALFLTAASFGSSALQTWLGTGLGLLAAVSLGLLLFAGSRRINLRLFFQVTGIVLLFIAAGLVGRGVHELQEVGILPALIDPLYNLGGILDQNGAVGSFLQVLLGYNASPSLLETVVYVSYLAVVGLLVWRSGLAGAARPALSNRKEKGNDCEERAEAQCT